MSNKNIKFAFFGTPDIATQTLEIIKTAGFMPAVIITAPDRPSGRKMLLTPPPVKTWALENNVPILQPEKLDEDFALKLSTFNFQLSIVVAYGKLFPENLIDLPSHGTLNIHYSLLPKYRGASPVQSAILNGEEETGVSIQKMVKEMDAGALLSMHEVDILPDEKTPELLDRLVKVGTHALIDVLPNYIEGKIKLIEQDHSQATYCKKIKKEDGLIDLNGNAKENYNKYRAFYDWPSVYFFVEKNDKKIRLIIKDASLENGEFKINKVLPEGKKEMPYADFLRGL